MQTDYHSSRLSASLAPYFTEHVRIVLEKWIADPGYPLYGRDISGGGLRVYTTLYAELQALAQSAIEDKLSVLRKVIAYQRSKPSAQLYSTGPEDYQSHTPGTDYKPFEHFWASNSKLSGDFIRGTARFDTLSAQGVTVKGLLRTGR